MRVEGFQRTFVCGIWTNAYAKLWHTDPIFESSTLDRTVKMRTQWYCYARPTSYKSRKFSGAGL